MQILQVLKTMEWLDSVAKPFIQSVEVITSRSSKDFTGGNLLVALYEHSRMTEIVRANANAVAVLEAFKLADLFLDRETILQILTKYQESLATNRRPDQPEEVIRHEVVAQLHSLLWSWKRVMACAEPLKKLTIPASLAGSELGEEILTVNISEREHLDLRTMTKTLAEIEALYDTLERIHGSEAHYPPLEIVKIESGTDLRIDLRGLGEPIKEIKNLIVEVWTKHRHRRVDEIVDHNRAVASSIQLIEEVDRKIKKGHLTDEDGNRFKRAIVSNTLGLFKNGALIEEIPKMETVDNVKLLDAFGPKLLAAPEEANASVNVPPPLPTADSDAQKPAHKPAKKSRRPRDVN